MLTKLRSIGVAVNVGSMHGGSTNDLLFLPADRESTIGLTWHLSTINNFAWHPYLRYWHAEFGSVAEDTRQGVCCANT